MQTLAYEVLGPQPAPSGPPVVLLPAFPFGRELWRAAGQRLVATATTVLVDLPGLGESPLPAGDPELATSGDGVVDVLDRLGHDRAVLAGVSMGGYVALAVAQRHPQRLAGLALVDTKADADGDEARANRFRMAEAVLAETGTRALLPMLDTLLGATSHATRPQIVSLVRSWLVAAPPSGVAWSQRAMAARPDRLAALAGLDVPVAVVVGEEDGITPLACARVMVEAVRDGVLSVLPGAGHLSPLERPDAVADALTALLTRVR